MFDYETLSVKLGPYRDFLSGFSLCVSACVCVSLILCVCEYIGGQYTSVCLSLSFNK